jgi:hypothetical protein
MLLLNRLNKITYISQIEAMAKYGKGILHGKRIVGKHFCMQRLWRCCYADKAAEKHLQSSKKNY